MVQPSLLIFCTSPASRVDELEHWLVKRVAALDPEHVVLYQGQGQGSAGLRANDAGGAWFLTVSDTAATGAPVCELVTEMRLLGLTPVVFRPGPLPSPYEGLANIF